MVIGSVDCIVNAFFLVIQKKDVIRMILDYPQKQNGMYILKKNDFDIIAEAYLNEHYPSALKFSAAVDIRHIAGDICNLTVVHRQITKSGVVLGLIAFGDIEITIRNELNQKEAVPLSEGTVIIDNRLTDNRRATRYRFTLAHEVAHWLLHRTYHSPTNQQYQLRNSKPYIACRQ